MRFTVLLWSYLGIAASWTIAATATWSGSSSSNFIDPNNWNPPINLLDSEGDVLTIGAGSPYDPIYNNTLPTRPNGFNTTAQAHFVMVDGELLPYGNNTLNGDVRLEHGSLNMRGNVYLGNGAAGILTVNGGSFTYKNTLYIGRNSGGNGILNVWGGQCLVDRPAGDWFQRRNRPDQH